MTLGDFLNLCDQSNVLILFFLIAMPLTALLAGVFGKGEGHTSPWKYLYMVVMYMVCIPGIFAITLNVYLIVIEGRSILDANMFTQILPVVCMFLTLRLIRWNVPFDKVPGFGKLGGLILVLTLIISLLWILEKTNIFVISIMPFSYFIILFVVILIGLRFGLKRMFG